MDILTRITNLENFVFSLAETINRNKFYGDADTAGTRQSVSDITPYTDTKTAYYNESEKTFYEVPDGNITVFFDNYNGSYGVKRVADRVVITFERLTEATNITISIN